jgi:hypothetical protein
MKNVSPNPGCLRLSRSEFATHLDSASGEQVFDVAVAEIETMVEPDRVLNDGGRKPVSFVETGRSGHWGMVAQALPESTATSPIIAEMNSRWR